MSAGAANAVRSAGIDRRRLRLIVLNGAGGLAVLGSYVWGVQTQPEAAGALWGNVPEPVRPPYIANMFLAAAGYFAFTSFVLRELVPARTRIAGRLGYGVFEWLYLLVLVPSALWLPLTVAMIHEPSPWRWALVCVDLGLVASGSLGLLVAILALDGPTTRGRRIAVAGLLPFCLQTVVLDAIVWTLSFPAR